MPATYSLSTNLYGPEPIVSVICLQASVLATCSGMMNRMEALPQAIASRKIGTARFSVIFKLWPSATPQASTNFAAACLTASRDDQRIRLWKQSCARTGSSL